MDHHPPTENGGAESRPERMLTIGALSRATSIPIPTLRTWERRYGEPRPARRPSGHRLYPVSMVARMRNVAALLEYGHRAAALLAMTTGELDTLLAQMRAGRSPIARVQPPSEPSDPEREELLRAVRRLEREALLERLRRNWSELGPMRFLTECAGPFMAEVGRAWQERTIEVRHEHFASACVAELLEELRRPYERAASGPRVVATTLPDDPHEGGLQMASLVLSLRGFRVEYLGARVPLDRIAAAARAEHTEAVMVSVSALAAGLRASNLLTLLREVVPGDVPVWAGGAGAPAAHEGVRCFSGLEEFDRWLGGLLERQH